MKSPITCLIYWNAIVYLKHLSTLSLKVLTEVSCTVDHDLAKRLESYRTMKKGNTAPDIVFKGNYLGPGYSLSNFPNRLSSINSKFIVVVFGASWCPKCTEDLPEIARFYTKWKAQGVEVVFVSLDEDKETYNQFVTDFPFISTCDYRKWESDIVKDYYVFATPTMFRLGQQTADSFASKFGEADWCLGGLVFSEWQ